MYSRGYNISMSNSPSKNNHVVGICVEGRKTGEVDDARAMKIERAGGTSEYELESGDRSEVTKKDDVYVRCTLSLPRMRVVYECI